jgi:hypothetical protein
VLYCQPHAADEERLKRSHAWHYQCYVYTSSALTASMHGNKSPSTVNHLFRSLEVGKQVTADYYVGGVPSDSDGDGSSDDSGTYCTTSPPPASASSSDDGNAEPRNWASGGKRHHVTDIPTFPHLMILRLREAGHDSATAIESALAGIHVRHSKYPPCRLSVALNHKLLLTDRRLFRASVSSKEQQVMYGQGRDGKFIRNRSRPPSLQCVVNSHIVPLSLSLSLSLSRTHLLANRRSRKRGHHRERSPCRSSAVAAHATMVRRGRKGPCHHHPHHRRGRSRARCARRRAAARDGRWPKRRS